MLINIKNISRHTRYLYCLVGIMFVLGAYPVEAAPQQGSARRQAAKAVEKLSPSEQVAVAYADSLRGYKLRVDSLMALRDSLNALNDSLLAVNDSLNALHDGLQGDGELTAYDAEGSSYRLFSPLNFYHGMAQRRITMEEDNGVNGRDSLVDLTLAHVYLNRPDLVRYTDTRLKQTRDAGQIEDDGVPGVRYVDLKSQVEPLEKEVETPQTVVDDEIELFVAKPNFWTFTGDYNVQFMQNYVSDNWYKGGSNYYSVLGTATLQYNYNNKQKVKWDNKLEMKFGLQNNESDTVNNVKSTEDLLRLTSSLGIQAHKQWYYSGQVIVSTQFAQGRVNNDRTAYSDFMSPFTLNVSIGMDYTVATKNNKLTGKVHLAPFAYNMKYVDRLALSTNFGLEEGHHTLHDYGSQMLTELAWAPISNFKWSTRLYAYTTYENFLLEWENTLTFKFSQYISANVFLYPRFDDSASRDEGSSYWQFKEYVSFGFTYSM